MIAHRTGAHRRTPPEPVKTLIRFISLAFAVLLIAMLAGTMPSDAAMLSVYATSAARPALEEAARNFGSFGELEMRTVTGPSATMLRLMRITRSGDIFISSSDTIMDQAASLRLIDSGTRVRLSRLTLALYVQAGNPYGIGSVGDLLGRRFRIAVCDPDLSGAGIWTDLWLTQWLLPQERELFRENIALTLQDSEGVLNAVALNNAHAGIGWMVLGLGRPAVTTIRMPGIGTDGLASMTAAVSRFTHQKATARAFLDYLLSDEGRAIFLKHGYLVEGETTAGQHLSPPP